MNTAPTSMSPTSPSMQPESEGNTFQSLKGMFKEKYSTCKKCGKPFSSKQVGAMKAKGI